MTSQQDETYMRLALTQAEYAGALGEVPVGAVIIKNNSLIATGHNRQITDNDPCAHAEIIALRKAGIVLQNYRLVDTILYVTLEPCAMCFTALIHARIKRIVFAASDPKTGVLGGCINLSKEKCFNHQLEIASGILQTQASNLLTNFFKERRNSKS